MTAETLAAGAWLFKPHRATLWEYAKPEGGASYGHQELTTDPAPMGAQIYYSLPAEAQQINVKILSLDRQVIAEIAQPAGKAGLNRVEWNLRQSPPRVAGDQQQAAAAGRGGQRGGAPGGGAAGHVHHQPHRERPGTHPDSGGPP